MDIIEIKLEKPFDLRDTLHSGQSFQWEEMNIEGIDGYAGCIGDNPPSWIAQKKSGEILCLKGHEERISKYFGLNLSPKKIWETFPKNDEILSEAIKYSPGIRLTHQPLWECLATFITSSQKKVSHIRSISMTIRKRYGNKYTLNDREFYSYPTYLKIAETSEDELRKCSLGYRAKSLFLTSNYLKDKVNKPIDEFYMGNYDEVKSLLMELHGVGNKIADCVLLFGLGKRESFPIDVWMERILHQKYKKRIKGDKLQKWARDYFGENAGYAQQYLFHFARKNL